MRIFSASARTILATPVQPVTHKAAIVVCIDEPSIELRAITNNIPGKAINISRTSLNHAISYPLTNLYNLEHGCACAYSVIATIDMFKSDIEKLPFSKHLIDARNLISNIDLKSMVKMIHEDGYNKGFHDAGNVCNQTFSRICDSLAKN